ncbi:lipid-A-disaccharide synthase [Stenotrophomonas sp. STM01]|uniref:lipid-A-disaccharide synthase n=1 Tax=Stenotrophomonas sp. STM01 TaxID=2769278 RepID=UPI001CE20363|nr:lipid-A-disaccharide synthase [Stenotrophomonas sp. STM01]
MSMGNRPGNGELAAASAPTTAQPAALPASLLPVSRRKVRIALVAGEASGDGLGAGLIKALRARYPDAEFAGIGGDAMRNAGCETWFDASELALMGLAEILRHLPRLLKLRKAFRQRVLDWQPDVFIGIDAPDFNLAVEKWLKQRGIRTVHYVSPSVWAWREKRAEKIGASADLVLCLFPMEPPIYARHGIDARFVGHPMADDIPLQSDRLQARQALDIPAQAPVLAVLPGSRLGEVSRLGPPFFAAAWQLCEDRHDLHLVVPAANARCEAMLVEQIRAAALPSARVHLLDGRAREAMTAADVVMLASGTATLETMLVKRPMVVGYRVSELTYRIVSSLGLIKVNRYALPNVLAGKDLAPELIQHDCTPDNLAGAVRDWFDNPARVAGLQDDYLRLHQQLRQDASARAADAVAGLLDAPARQAQP